MPNWFRLWWQQQELVQWIETQGYLPRWLLALVIFVLVLIALKVTKKLLIRHSRLLAERRGIVYAALAADVVAATRSLFIVVESACAAALVLPLQRWAIDVTWSVAIITLLIQAGIWGDAAVRFFVAHYAKGRLETDAESVTTISALGALARLIIGSVVFLLIFENLGINVTTMVAGLGIGGVAVALAAQNILGDLFASTSIVLDKPFVIGDFITVGEHMGTIERIGLKTTRIRSLSGEQLIFSNNDLLQSRIRNFKRMVERRVVFAIGVTYQTPYEKVAAIPAMLRAAVESRQQVRFDRAHFKEYGAFSLNYEIVYYVLSPDYAVYMDIQQAINLDLYRKFEQEGIDFAYPTQTVMLEPSGPASALPGPKG